MVDQELSRATQYLNMHPELRELKHSEGFRERYGHYLENPVVIDGVEFYFPHGDIQMEIDDLILEYAIAIGITSNQAVDRELATD